ncbi:LpqB family beta-propeller domain-containing protein [Antribacter gilvus]|uniref:LpqB family beta-propeller domain-containing protein n=1 Tax=Antribacter gilvus TaxID=2304675 RepID=UPI000F7775EA|nr:LpqB family beta-propeller domain-containing protein [Antribacter gilvus]
MTRVRTPRRLLARLVALLAVPVVLLGGCATIPTSGEPWVGDVDAAAEADPRPIVYLPASGPREGAGPEAIVRGFLMAASTGPNNPARFTVANQFLEPLAVSAWNPDERVFVMQADPVLTADPVPEDALTTTVRFSAEVTATVDERGVLTEQQVPTPAQAEFTLVKGADGQWRISELDNGLYLHEVIFTNSYRPVRLYFPTPDRSYWVPDQRWFPENGWRAKAVEEVLAGPPAYLQGAAISVVPEGTGLSIGAVAENPETGELEIPLTSQISGASDADRALVAAQIGASLAPDGRLTQPVALSDGSARLEVRSGAGPSLPRTEGRAVVLTDGTLHRAGDDGRLVEFERETDWSEVGDPTALAVGPAATPVVVRDGTSTLRRLTGEPAVLLTGTDLAPPSIDRFSIVWTSGSPGSVVAVTPDGAQVPLTGDWLTGRQVTGVRVSPEGARVAVVSRSVSGESQVHVAGVVRDQAGAPTALAGAVRVAVTVPHVREVQWAGQTYLGLLTADAGETSVWVTGVGGYAPDALGRSRELAGVVGPQRIAAGSNDQGIHAVDDDGTLVFRRLGEGTWTDLLPGTAVSLVAFPG